MRIKEFIFLLVKSLNPFNYEMLVARKKRDAAKYFALLMLFFVFVSAVINLPSFFDLPQTIKKFNFTGIGEKTVLLNEPKIVLDFTGEEKNLTDEMLIISEDEITQWRFRPDIDEFKIFEQETNQIPDYFYWIIMIFLLPSYFLVYYVVTSIRYAVIAVAFIIFGLLFKSILKRQLSVFRLARAVIFSFTVLIILNAAMILTEFNLYPLVLYSVFFIVMMLSVTKKPIMT